MRIPAACCSLALIACLGLPAIVRAQKRSYDVDRSTNFSKFKTFELVKGTAELEPFLDKRVVAAIESRLPAKGLTRRRANPDVYVLYHIVLGVQKRVTAFGSRSDPFPWHGGFDPFDARLHDIPVSAIVIDVADAATRELVWRGVGIDDIDLNAKPKQREKAIDTAVDTILKNYPPKLER